MKKGLPPSRPRTAPCRRLASSEMRPYDLVTFDCYGTLIDWEAGIGRTVRRLARGRRLPVRAMVSRYIAIELGLEQAGYRPYREILAMGLRLLFEEHGIRLDRSRTRGLERSLPSWPAFRETRRVLLSLKASGCRIGILSNIDDTLLRRSLQRIRVPFDHLVTAQQVRSYKPRTRHWERVLELSKTPKRRVLHVAASQLHDIIPAKMLGLSCVWINRTRERRMAVRPDHTFTDLRPLTRLLGTREPCAAS